MNPGYGIIMWIIIGALAGWIGSMIMGTRAQQGALSNVIIGVVGAVIGGFITRNLLGANAANHGFIASFFVALLGAVILIGVWKLVSGRRRIA